MVREKISLPTCHNDFEFTDRENADYAVQRVGAAADDFTSVAKASHYFIKSSKQVKDIVK